jgi:hypothetical protein
VKRRDFLKGLIAIPAAGVMAHNVDAKPKPVLEPKSGTLTIRRPVQYQPTSNKLLTPADITREALAVLNEKLQKIDLDQFG